MIKKVKKKVLSRATAVREEPGRLVVCTLPGGYTRENLDLPQGKIVRLSEKEFNQAKNIRGVIEVKI